jgi:hypothetical protein
MNFYKVSGQVTAFVVTWIAENIKFSNIVSFERKANVFTLKTQECKYELKFKKIE